MERGPKTYKVSEEIISSNHLIKELDINPDLPPVKKQQLEQVIQANQLSFGLDDWLRHLDAKVQIPLIPGAKPIPPFPSSPVK